MTKDIESPKESPELGRTLQYLFNKIEEYEAANLEYGHTLRNVVFGVNGNRAAKMRLVGESLISAAATYASSPKDLINNAFRGNPEPDKIVLRLNTFYGDMLRDCSPSFLDYRPTKREGIKLEDAEIRFVTEEHVRKLTHRNRHFRKN